MSNTATVKILGALALGATLAMPAFAAQNPVSVDESRPSMTGKTEKGKAGEATMPTKGPKSVDDSNPSRKAPPAPAAKADSKNMPNPKTPSGVDESKPDATGKSAPAYGDKGSMKKDTKAKDTMAK